MSTHKPDHYRLERTMKKPAAKRQTKVVTPHERVALLEQEITAALKRHGAKMVTGSYMEKVGTKDACVCAIGAALLTRAETKHKAVALQGQAFQFADAINASGEHVYPGQGVRKLRRWAAEVVNDGITEDDLAQLEAGFELQMEAIAGNAPADFQSPFWQLGVKLHEQFADSGSRRDSYVVAHYKRRVELNWVESRRDVLRKEMGYDT